MNGIRQRERRYKVLEEGNEGGKRQGFETLLINVKSGL